jgi:hypothetical protein
MIGGTPPVVAQDPSFAVNNATPCDNPISLCWMPSASPRRCELGFLPALNRSLWDTTISADRSYRFQLPTYTPSSNSIPTSLQRALAIAKTDRAFASATTISLGELNALVPDQYTGIRADQTGAFNKSYGLPYVVYSDTSTLTELPTFSWTMPWAPMICSGTDAISLTVAVILTSPGRRPGNIVGIVVRKFRP